MHHRIVRNSTLGHVMLALKAGIQPARRDDERMPHCVPQAFSPLERPDKRALQRRVRHSDCHSRPESRGPEHGTAEYEELSVWKLPLGTSGSPWTCTPLAVLSGWHMGDFRPWSCMLDAGLWAADHARAVYYRPCDVCACLILACTSGGHGPTHCATHRRKRLYVTRVVGLSINGVPPIPAYGFPCLYCRPSQIL
jgi:hypothetical protein